MRRPLLAFFLLAFSVTLAACDASGSEEAREGTMYLRVVTSYGEAVAGASVATSPATGLHTTGALGTLRLDGVAVGTYTAVATLAAFGSGEAAVVVRPGEVEEAVIMLQYGVFESYAPTARILTPGSDGDAFAPGEPVAFEARVSDLDTPLPSVRLAWTSSIDGPLGTGHPDAEGTAVFETTALSPGEHVVSLQAVDPDGHATSDSVTVVTLAPPRPLLTDAEILSQGVELRWSLPAPEPGPAYAEVLVERGAQLDGPWVGVAASPTTARSYTDEAPPLAEEVYYRVTVVNERGYARASEPIRVESPVGLIIRGRVADAHLHPKRPILYLIDQSGYGFSSPSRILKIDAASGELLGERILSFRPGSTDLRDNGSGLRLYVPSLDGWVYTYDADSLEPAESISTGIAIESVVTDGRGYLFASVYPSPWWEQPVRSYSLETGAYISGAEGFDGGRLRMLPDGRGMIAISQSGSPANMGFYVTGTDGTIVSYHEDRYHGDHPLSAAAFRVSPDGQYAVTSYAGAIYTADTDLEYLGGLQRAGMGFADFAFTPDAGSLYAGSDTERMIVRFSGETRQREAVAATRGYVQHLFYQGERVYAVVTPQIDSYGERIYALERVEADAFASP